MKFFVSDLFLPKILSHITHRMRYWKEGGNQGIGFYMVFNMRPVLVQCYLFLLRKSCIIQEIICVSQGTETPTNLLPLWIDIQIL